jgi:hypothetical protein
MEHNCEFIAEFSGRVGNQLCALEREKVADVDGKFDSNWGVLSCISRVATLTCDFNGTQFRLVSALKKL